MIKLSKHTIPDVLAKNGAKWTAELLAIIAAGKKPSEYLKGKYRHKEVKTAVLEETSGKCAYCESKILHITYGDIEHILPKHGDINLSFSWPNLTAACDVCNTNKGIKIVIDPFSVDPINYVYFLGPMLFPKNSSYDAMSAETILKLNRTALLEKRKELLDRLNLARERMKSHPVLEEKILLYASLKESQTSSNEEYSACARDFFESCDKVDAIS
jgi:hypothetical protein